MPPSLRRDLYCPQCEGRDVWHVEQIRERGVGPFEKPIQPLNVVLQERFFRLYDGTGYFETYICKRCGFTEWYANGIDDLHHDPEKGVRLLTGTDQPKTGPYR